MKPRRSALVTGATSGIGLGIARQLARAGYDVTLSGFGQPDEITAIQSSIEKTTGVRVRHSAADLTNPAAVREMITEAALAFDGLSILVNNAGIQFVSPLENFPEEKWQAVIAVNLSAAFYTTKAVLPGMIERRWGRIINIASAHGLVASPDKAAYVASKHGLIGLTKATALEVAPHGITCNAVCPGFVLTPLVEQQIQDKVVATGWTEKRVMDELFLAKHACKEFIKIEEVAALVEFLCSESARAINGASLPIDSAWTAM